MGEPENTQVVDEQQTNTQASDEATAEKTFTQEEVNNMISDRLKREQAKSAKLVEQAKQEALEAFKKQQEEDKELSKLSENERLQKRLEKLEKENADLLAKQQLAVMTAQARQELAKDGYTVGDEMLGLIVSNDEEATLNNMNVLKAYTDGIKEQLESERAKGVTPKTSSQPAEPLSPFEKKMQEIEKGKI